MKKIFSRSIIFVLSLILSCFILPSFNSVAKAEDETVETLKYSIIGSDFNKNGDNLSKYNISDSNVSSFTPFDLENGIRMDGYSFRFLSGERNQIKNQFVYAQDIDAIQDNYSLFLWIYFDSIYLHDLTISLEFENGSSLKWVLTNDDLINLLKKTTDFNILSQPFAWNQLELPFSSAQMSGSIFNSNKLNQVSKLIVDFTSEEVTGESQEVQNPAEGTENQDPEDVFNITYSILTFYDVYISKSQKSDIRAVEKQNYIFYDFNFYSEEFINSICVGDTITLPSNYKTVVNYAWNGYDDLKNGGIPSVTWRIVVKTPNSNEQFLYPSFGDKLTFETEGTYEIFYQCLDNRLSNTNAVISCSVKINVRTLRPVYFDKSSYNLNTDKTYMINVYTSSAFTEITDLQFVSNDENIILDYKGNGLLAVTVKKAGEYSIGITVKGIRAVTNVEREYETSLKIIASSAKQNSNDEVVRILLFVALGVFIVVFIGFMIKIFIQTRKFDVK